MQDGASVAAAAVRVQAALAGASLYGIVNNAGTGCMHGVSPAQVLDTNLVGPKRVVDSFLPLLSTTEGRIVNLGSGSGPGWMSRASPEIRAVLCSRQATWDQVHELAQANLASKGEGENAGKDKEGEDWNAYGLSKATLITYTMILACEHPNILSSVVSPGFIATEMTKGWGASLAPEQGTVSTRHCLFDMLGGNGWMWGSDGKRSPIDASREPGDSEYTDPTGRGF